MDFAITSIFNFLYYSIIYMAGSRRRSRRSKKASKSRRSRKSKGSRRSTRPQNRWLKALKKYNQGKAKYIIPKKGTPEYRAVRSIMDKC